MRLPLALLAAALTPALALLSAPALAEPEPSPSAPPVPEPSTAAPPAPDPSAAAAPEGDAAEPEPEEPIEVTVAGTPIGRTAGSAHVITSKELRRFSYTDPHAVLSSVPGVYTRGEDGVGLRPNIGLRGVNPDRSKKVTLTEDGVLFGPAPYSAPAAYFFPLMSRFVSVRVLKGPSAITEGPQTVSGAIDFVTRGFPANPSGSITAGFGQYGYGTVHGWFGSSDEHVAWLLEGAHLGSNGFKELPSGADTGFYRNEWMLKGAYTFDPAARVRQELRWKLLYSDELSNETYLGISDADFREDPNRRYGASALDRMQNHRTGFVLSHAVDTGNGLTLLTTAYRNDYSRTWRKVNGFRGGPSLFDVMTHPDTPLNAVYYSVIRGDANSASSGEAIYIGPNQRDFVSQGLQSRLRWEGATGPFHHRAEAGARLHYDRIERRHSENAYDWVDGDLYPEASPTVVTAFNEAWTQALAVYATDAVSWERLTLTPGVRVEVMRSALDDHLGAVETRRLASVVLPGVGLFSGVTDELGLLLGVYRGFSPPPPGSPSSIKPESSVNYEGGARYVSRALRAELVAYYNAYSNITDVCTLSSGCVDTNLDRQFDAGRARIYGLEAFFKYELPAGALTLPLVAAYTLTRAHFLNDFTSEDPIFGEVRAGDEMPYVPRHQLNASVGVENDDGGVAVAANYVSPMREEAGRAPIAEGVSTDEQFWIDASARYRVYGPVSLWGNVRNVGGRQFIVSHRPYGARPNAPRWVQVGATIDF
ncbi:MAG: TonB-dependent receptor [Sorangiineae bacterium]|nr:TonB-dependent receptor [Polyangiaceae bacterium]MEB2323935.1 TonB-dependent receptor [Sorangiineae bacterium]